MQKMAVTAEQLFKNLSVSGLMTTDDVSALMATLPKGERREDAQFIAQELVRQGKLTRYQANALYQGKTKGFIFGEYTVLDRVGAGGMGQVYKAQHRRMERIVALKVLPPSATTSPDAVQRFQREVKAAARLLHPNIVTAFDAGEAGGVYFLVMEYVEGWDLAELPKERGPLSESDAISYILQAAKALQFAHSMGVIHRDIKPANLLLDHTGTVKVLDMGLARLDSTSATPSDLTHSGQVMGTVDFMAPEQANDTRHVDGRADIYSLGCTLYRIVTGQNVYRGETVVERMMAHRDKPIPSMRVARPDVSDALDQVFRKMVAKRPEDRYQTMDEVVTALQKLAQVTASQRVVAVPVASPSVTLVAGMPPGPGDSGPFRTTTAISGAAGGTLADAAERRLPATVMEHAKKHSYVVAKVLGTLFVTIIGPVLAGIMLKYTDKVIPDDPQHAPASTTAAAPVADSVAANPISKPGAAMSEPPAAPAMPAAAPIVVAAKPVSPAEPAPPSKPVIDVPVVPKPVVVPPKPKISFGPLVGTWVVTFPHNNRTREYTIDADGNVKVTFPIRGKEVEQTGKLVDRDGAAVLTIADNLERLRLDGPVLWLDQFEPASYPAKPRASWIAIQGKAGGTVSARLFNGTDLTGWYSYLGHGPQGPKVLGKNNDLRKVFQARSSMIRVSGEIQGVLTTTKEYHSYHLIAEYKWGEKVWPPDEGRSRRSGILLHGTGPDGAVARHYPHSYRCMIREGATGNIVIENGPSRELTLAAQGQRRNIQLAKTVSNGFFYEPGKPLSTLSNGFVAGLCFDTAHPDELGFHSPHDLERPHGDWNTLECLCQGDRLFVLLNGTLINAASQLSESTGKISLVSDHAEIFFRNLIIRPLR
jgi:serine/threonine protein kinase